MSAQEVKLLTVVVSCEKHSGLWPKILGRGIKDLIILCGGSKRTLLDGQILYLQCSDLYDGLSEKMIAAFEYILQSQQFSSYTHILKADDHDTEFTSEQIKNIETKHSVILQAHDYTGQVIIKNPAYLSKHHFGKVPTTSKWYNKEYLIPGISYCGGGDVYILSRKAIQILSKSRATLEQYPYEDVMMGDILLKDNIKPYKLDFGIKHWNGVSELTRPEGVTQARPPPFTHKQSAIDRSSCPIMDLFR
jgi:Galactosyltransferase